MSKAKSLQERLKKEGYKMPHGYDIVKRTKKTTVKKKAAKKKK